MIWLGFWCILCSTLGPHLSFFPIDMFARNSHPAPCLPKAWELDLRAWKFPKSRLWNAGALTCSMGGHRHLVVEAASWCGLCGWFTWGSLLSKGPEVVWCCLYIFNSIPSSRIWTVMNWPPNASYDQFHTCLFGRWHGPFPEFLLPLRGFMVPQSKNFRTWAFWTVRSSSQQWMNLHDRSQCTLDIETISAIVSDGFTGWIHWSTLILLGLPVKRLVSGSAVSCFTERVPKMVLDWNPFFEIFGGVPCVKKLETSGTCRRPICEHHGLKDRLLSQLIICHDVSQCLHSTDKLTGTPHMIFLHIGDIYGSSPFKTYHSMP